MGGPPRPPRCPGGPRGEDPQSCLPRKAAAPGGPVVEPAWQGIHPPPCTRAHPRTEDLTRATEPAHVTGGKAAPAALLAQRVRWGKRTSAAQRHHHAGMARCFFHRAKQCRARVAAWALPLDALLETGANNAAIFTRSTARQSHAHPGRHHQVAEDSEVTSSWASSWESSDWPPSPAVPARFGPHPDFTEGARTCSHRNRQTPPSGGRRTPLCGQPWNSRTPLRRSRRWCPWSCCTPQPSRSPRPCSRTARTCARRKSNRSRTGLSRRCKTRTTAGGYSRGSSHSSRTNQQTNPRSPHHTFHPPRSRSSAPGCTRWWVACTPRTRP